MKSIIGSSQDDKTELMDNAPAVHEIRQPPLDFQPPSLSQFDDALEDKPNARPPLLFRAPSQPEPHIEMSNIDSRSEQGSVAGYGMGLTSEMFVAPSVNSEDEQKQNTVHTLTIPALTSHNWRNSQSERRPRAYSDGTISPSVISHRYRRRGLGHRALGRRSHRRNVAPEIHDKIIETADKTAIKPHTKSTGIKSTGVGTRKNEKQSPVERIKAMDFTFIKNSEVEYEMKVSNHKLRILLTRMQRLRFDLYYYLVTLFSKIGSEENQKELKKGKFSWFFRKFFNQTSIKISTISDFKKLGERFYNDIVKTCLKYKKHLNEVIKNEFITISGVVLNDLFQLQRGKTESREDKFKTCLLIITYWRIIWDDYYISKLLTTTIDIFLRIMKFFLVQQTACVATGVQNAAEFFLQNVLRCFQDVYHYYNTHSNRFFDDGDKVYKECSKQNQGVNKDFLFYDNEELKKCFSDKTLRTLINQSYTELFILFSQHEIGDYVCLLQFALVEGKNVQIKINLKGALDLELPYEQPFLYIPINFITVDTTVLYQEKREDQLAIFTRQIEETENEIRSLKLRIVQINQRKKKQNSELSRAQDASPESRKKHQAVLEELLDLNRLDDNLNIELKSHIKIKEDLQNKIDNLPKQGRASLKQKENEINTKFGHDGYEGDMKEEIDRLQKELLEEEENRSEKERENLLALNKIELVKGLGKILHKSLNELYDEIPGEGMRETLDNPWYSRMLFANGLTRPEMYIKDKTLIDNMEAGNIFPSKRLFHGVDISIDRNEFRNENPAKYMGKKVGSFFKNLLTVPSHWVWSNTAGRTPWGRRKISDAKVEEQSRSLGRKLKGIGKAVLVTAPTKIVKGLGSLLGRGWLWGGEMSRKSKKKFRRERSKKKHRRISTRNSIRKSIRKNTRKSIKKSHKYSAV